MREAAKSMAPLLGAPWSGDMGTALLPLPPPAPAPPLAAGLALPPLPPRRAAPRPLVKESDRFRAAGLSETEAAGAGAARTLFGGARVLAGGGGQLA